MHSAATLLLPVAAEKSKVPFYIAGGVLAAWAVVVSMLFGLRRAEFPTSLLGERVVIAISVVLVLAAVSTAVITSSSPAKSSKASAAGPAASAPAPPPSAPAPGASAPAPAPSAPSSKKAAGKHHGAKPKATTGAPTPPSSPASAAPSTIALAADPNGLLSFDKKQLSAKAGSVTISFTNSSPLEHNVTIAEGSKVLGATPSFVRGSKTVTLTLNAGTYTFYCSVPGHRQGGMEGTLTVA